MTTALVNKIIPFSVVDGMGNRTSIFLQGCNIRCSYCHNPETQSVCINCGDCVKVCPSGSLFMEDKKVIWNPETCINCDKCIATCKYNASPKVKEMTAEEVFAEVKKAMPFIRGITISGGECTLYPEFLTELFRLAKRERLTCLIDSNGSVDLEEHEELLTLCDGVMLDVKSWDEEIYTKLTGGDNSIVKKNLKLLARRGKLEEIRIVCLPGEVDAKEVIKQIAAEALRICPDLKLKLIKYRKFGVTGAFSELESPDDEYMDELEKYAKKLGFYHTIIT